MLDDFRLEIKPERNTTMSHITIRYHSIDCNGYMKLSDKKLIGTPIFVNPSNIYIIFTESSGQFIIFSFSYVKYKLRHLYFRRGAIITTGRDAARQPLMQSFVMFDKVIAKENEKYIPGFLLIYDSVFHIPEDRVNQLKEESNKLKILFKNLEYIFNANIKSYYTVNETQILASIDDNTSKADVVKALQLLKANAIEPKRVYFPEIDVFSEFSKRLNSPK